MCHAAGLAYDDHADSSLCIYPKNLWRKPMNQPILVVDDDEAIRELVAETLMDRGYTVISADSGMAAVTAVARQNPVLIVLDIAVPIMAGCVILLVFNRRAR